MLMRKGFLFSLTHWIEYKAPRVLSSLRYEASIGDDSPERLLPLARALIYHHCPAASLLTAVSESHESQA